MDKIAVFNKKNNSQVVDEFLNVYLDTLDNIETFDNNSELHKKFIYWISKYAIKTYNINFINVEFFDSDLITDAYSDNDFDVYLSTALLQYNNFEDFLFESILSIFHEVNHIHIGEIEKGYKKGLNGEKNINLTTNGAESIFEYFKAKGFNNSKMNLLRDLIYLNSTNEAYAFYSSCKLGLKFVKELKDKLNENDISFEILSIIEQKLNDKFNFYVNKFKNAKIKKDNIMNQLFLKRTLQELEDETIFELLSNKNVYEDKYSAFLTAIELGIYDENTIENYKKAILINKMGINKAKLYCDLINVLTYKISKKDLIIAIKLIENDEISKGADNRKKIKIIKDNLNNIDDKVIDKVYREMKSENLEKVA